MKPPLKTKMPKRVPHTGLTIWSWNVESVCGFAFPEILVPCLEEARADICFLQGTRLSGHREFTLTNGWFFANLAGGKGEEGVAFLCSSKVSGSLLGHTLYSRRHVQIVIRGVGGPMGF